jgi:RNA polymerase sigma-70 factor (ECF subfamily)
LSDPSSPFADEHLVGRCLAGDERAWSALVRRCTPIVFSLAIRSTRRREEAEDMTQEIFVKVSRTLPSYDRAASFKPWLLQVARNHLIDHHRSRRRERESTIELDALPYEPVGRPASQEGDTFVAQRKAIIAKALADVPDRLREAVMLRDVEGLEYEEIATVTGLPLGTVKSRISRGRLHLTEALRHLREELT